MLAYKTYFTYFLILFINWIHVTQTMNLLNKKIPLLNKEPEKEISEYIMTKSHLPSPKDSSKTPLLKTDNDVTYLLSKLTDEELVRLLYEQPHKSQYNLKDIVKITSYSNGIRNPPNFDEDISIQSKSKNLTTNSNANSNPDNNENHNPIYRLEHREVKPSQYNPQYEALQKLNGLLNIRASDTKTFENKGDEEMKKELLFDVLVAQLKTLCCKPNKNNNDILSFKSKPLLHDIMPEAEGRLKSSAPIEHMFLIINEEIKTQGKDEDLILVDPDSLGSNSSVMILGPVATPLADEQLKTVMNRITLELSKSEYMPLLKQLSDGTLSSENVKLASSVISGPKTRRYIKPHRCNHQSKLAKVYGGPKWIICTGYLNLNTPSLWD